MDAIEQNFTNYIDILSFITVFQFDSETALKPYRLSDVKQHAKITIKINSLKEKEIIMTLGISLAVREIELLN